MKKVLLINPPLYFNQGNPYSLDVSVPPLGLLYLASYIKKYSHRFVVKVLDVTPENYRLEEIGKLVDSYRPFVVGITSMTPQLQGAVEVAGYLKKNNPKIKIFLGGPHISADSGFINRHTKIFDYGITGEGEITFLESLEKLTAGKEIPKLQTGKIVMNLDEIPFPDRKMINRGKYSRHESMMYSRGCPYHCYYCSRPSISKKIRYRSAKNMIDEIKLAYNDCRGRVDFQDDTFTLDKRKVFEFCRQVEKSGLKINWRCQSRIDLVDEELLKIMAKAGCSLIHFGIESGNEKVRKNIVNKGSFSNAKIFEVFGLCRKQKIGTAAYFMIGHPGETWKDLADTKEMIFKLKPDILGLSIPTPFPGSRLYEIAAGQGIVSKKMIDSFAQKKMGEGYSGIYPVFIPDGVAKEELYSFMKKINRKFYINFHTFWERLKEDITSMERLKRDLSDLLSLVFKGVSARKPYIKNVKN